MLPSVLLSWKHRAIDVIQMKMSEANIEDRQERGRGGKGGSLFRWDRLGCEKKHKCAADSTHSSVKRLKHLRFWSCSVEPN